ncbi:asparagine-linked glycosylation protein [Arachnomyces sp. PD_36]|nr:asparagine-linked glycosylation protein [Arachnomyces sp. PD_36]
MSFILTFTTTVVALLTICLVTPALAGYVSRSIFRGIGWYVQGKTKGRRDLIISRVRVDEEEYRSERRRSGSGAEDEDWEKVEECYPAQTTPKPDDWDGIIGFFHPFCNAGGGGERVLWAAVRATQKRWPKAICAIYTGDHEADKATMLERVENRFNIRLHHPTVVLLYLSTRNYVLSSTYPHLTLLGQSLGSLVLAYDAFSLLVPDIFVDTMGYAFALAFCHYLFPSVPTGSYTHYPTISTDMLESLDDTSGQRGINAGAGVGWKGFAKKHYWSAFARLYGWVGGTIDVVMCNSSWTSAHIASLWGPSRESRKLEYKDPTVVFPPVAVTELETGIDINPTTERETREPTILYIAQFRPEKNHPLLLRSFARFLHDHNRKSTSSSSKPPQLILIGSVRHSTPDETHIYNLRLLAHELKIRNNTTFLCDASWPTILEHLSRASIGTNAMWNEHFGICVVEYQAAGLICVVHDSGGPKQDIVIDQPGGGDGGSGPTGFRATTEEEFASAFAKALELPEKEKVNMRMRARRSAKRFSDEEFEKGWVGQMEALVRLQVEKKAR